MVGRLRCAELALLFCLVSMPAWGEIRRWDNGQVIPGTAGITPGPGVQLDHRQLQYANLSKVDLTGATFEASNLSNALLAGSTLTNANFTALNLTNAHLGDAILTNAQFSNAVILGTRFTRATQFGFTNSQLYSTASYAQKNLAGVLLDSCNVSGWNLAGQNLRGGSFSNATLDHTNLSDADLTNVGLIEANLSGTNLRGANLTNADLNAASLWNADLTGATITKVKFQFTALKGFTKEQLYSTASHQQKNLQGVVFGPNNLSGWDFQGQDLRGANFAQSTISNANFSGAVITNAQFNGLTSRNADLSGANLSGSNLDSSDFRGSNFSGANLVKAFLLNSDFNGAVFRGADLRGAEGGNFTSASMTSAIRPDGTIRGLVLGDGQQLLVRDIDGGPSLRVLNVVSMTSNSRLTLSFGANPWDSLISFQPGIPVERGGTLELVFAAAVDPATQIGRTLRVFDWTGVSPTGEFQIGGPFEWDVSKLYTTGEVTLTAVPEPRSAMLLGAGALAMLAARRANATRRSALTV
jgi:uncharacterized protein YjbI with pentapeptide repeats